MKKLLKSGICGSMNSTYCTVCRRKVHICGYCSLNNTWTVTAFCQNAWKKKKKKKKKNKNKNAKRRRSKRGSKHTHCVHKLSITAQVPLKFCFIFLSMSCITKGSFEIRLFCWNWKFFVKGTVHKGKS